MDGRGQDSWHVFGDKSAVIAARREGRQVQALSDVRRDAQASDRAKQVNIAITAAETSMLSTGISLLLG